MKASHVIHRMAVLIDELSVISDAIQNNELGLNDLAARRISSESESIISEARRLGGLARFVEEQINAEKLRRAEPQTSNEQNILESHSEGGVKTGEYK